MEDDSTPTSADGYKALVHGHPTATVDTADSRYKSAAAAAYKAGLTQHQFSQMLGIEAQRVITSRAKSAPAAAAPTPSAPIAPATHGKIEGYASMTFAQKMAAAGHI